MVNNYKKDDEGNEIYGYVLDGKRIAFKDIFTDTYYAKTKDDDEYFPDTGQLAIQKFIPVYPIDRNQQVIFPKNANGDEMYIFHANKKINQSIVDVKNMRYAKTRDGKDIYPIYVSKDNKYYEKVLPHLGYAKDQDGFPYYPINEDGDEYVWENLLDYYPLSHDGKYIIPGKNGKPYFLINSQLSEKDIVEEHLKLDGSIDYYITNIKVNRIPRKVTLDYTVTLYNYQKIANGGLPRSKLKQLHFRNTLRNIFFTIILILILGVWIYLNALVIMSM